MENLSPSQDADTPASPISPQDAVDFGTTEVASEFIAAHVQAPLIAPTGGDFHATFPLKEDASKVAFVLGDVAGHGPEAGVHAEHLKAAIVGCLEEGLPPADALGFVNAAAEMDPNFPGFATVIAGTVEVESGEIVYASGGHEPALIAESPDTVQELTTTGPPVGAFGADEVRYTEREASLAPGATLLLYTDGVTEARRGRNFVGLERLRSWFVRFLTLPPTRLVQKLFGNALAFVGGTKFRDDVALLVLRRRKKTTPGG
jgi:sigma-B regulation protein RsbU (phosphoserine phosphatase)